jgi:CHAD domain-containing protein
VNPAARQLLGCIASSRAQLERQPLSDESVHAARKALKKARAALRLLRPGLGEALFRAENRALRDAGRCLSPLRDTKSQLDALYELRRRHAGKLRRARLDALETGLRAEQAEARRKLELQPCLALLERAGRTDLAHVDASVLEEGLGRVYRRGRKAFRQAGRSGTPEALHEWRKQVKYLHDALEALDGADRGKAARIAKRAAKLAKRLGDDHDLAVLAQRKRAPNELRKLIVARREKLQKRAFALGEKLYGQKPKRIAAKLELDALRDQSLEAPVQPFSVISNTTPSGSKYLTS